MERIGLGVAWPLIDPHVADRPAAQAELERTQVVVRCHLLLLLPPDRKRPAIQRYFGVVTARIYHRST